PQPSTTLSPYTTLFRSTESRRVNISGTPSTPEHRSRLFACVGALSVGLLGVVSLIGWCLNVEALKSIVPGAAPMKPNMAAGFVRSEEHTSELQSRGHLV